MARIKIPETLLEVKNRIEYLERKKREIDGELFHLGVALLRKQHGIEIGNVIQLRNGRYAVVWKIYPDAIIIKKIRTNGELYQSNHELSKGAIPYIEVAFLTYSAFKEQFVE